LPGRALAAEPGNLRARLYLANSLVRLGRDAEAATRYREFLAGSPEGAAAERVRKILDRLAPAPAGR
jgi:cytochrome c-type biogenesis protein CcmH/NrfG